MMGWLRQWWRESALVAVLALPWLSLLALGGAWLWQAGRVLEWAVGAALLALLAWPLRRAVRARAAARLAATLAARRGFDPADDTAEDKAARALVEARIAAAGPLDLSDRAAVEASLRPLIEEVARHYHPTAKRPVLEVTPPELLLLLERLSNRLRRFIRDVPFADRATLDRLTTAADFWTKHGGTLTRAYEVADAAWRMSRFARNPMSAALREAARIADVSTTGLLSDAASQQAHRALLREAGDAAIALYSGRLRMSEAELAALAPPPPEERPLHLAILGRPGAGVTTLAALLEGPAREAGFALLDRGDWAKADAVLLLTPALRPDREPDRALLEQVRHAAGAAPPPILVAMTHADALPPADRPAACLAVAEALDVAEVLPLALPPGGAPQGIAALLPALEREKPAARRARGERLRAGARRLDLGAEAGKLWRTGRSLLEGFTSRK